MFERHWTDAWRAAYAIVGRRECADDVAQDAFLKAFGALERFDVSRPFAPWLHRIVVNRALDELRSERRLVSIDELAEPAVWDVADGDAALLAAVADLPVDRRVVCVLRYGLGYSPTEIAGLLDVPVGTVNSRLGRALNDLRSREGVTDAR